MAAPQVLDTAILPDAADVSKILTAKLSYEAAQKTSQKDDWNKKHFNETPWGIAYNVSLGKYNKSVASYNTIKRKSKIAPQAKNDIALKYFIIAVAIGWQELIDQLKRTLKNWGYTTSDLQYFVNSVWLYSDYAEIMTKAFDNAAAGALIEQVKAFTKQELTEAIEKHDSLNSKLFTKEEVLKETVRRKMLEIVDEFVDNLREQNIKIKVDDILLVGSNASYNYTKDSDIDLHIIADTKNIKYELDIADALYSAYRTLFNKNLDINIYDIPLELYVETEKTPRNSNGVYSVKKDKWEKKPIPEDIPNYDKEALDKLVSKWEVKCKDLLDKIAADKLQDEKQVVELIEAIYEKLRKTGVAKSEYSIENLAFKELRNKGYLDKLKLSKHELISKRLSLEEELEAQNNFKKQDCILKIAGIYPAQFTSSNMFIISNIKEYDFRAIYNNLLKLTFVKGLTYVEQNYFDPRTSDYNVMLSKQYKIKGSIK